MAKKMISFEADDKLKEALRIEAFKRSVSVSAAIRQLLEEALKICEVPPSHEQDKN